MNTSYRYLLSRDTAAPNSRILLVCMLNPSTADEEKNDPTISRVCRLAENEEYGRLLVLNLLAVRATNPSDIWVHENPLGVDNYQTWDKVLKEELIPERDSVCVAWGRTPKDRRHLLHFLPALVEASCRLKLWTGPLMTWVQNIDGSPRHPLYIRTQTKLQPYDLDTYVKSILQRDSILLPNHLKDLP
ncbi:DUF1643 domain-containing protein [Chroococcidiopsis sp. FACHB-1243]|uniref:DUF1643 domain-containing protein n=1 Tax=Chroococcidiopsis sp. [FACHB-1243] TaxID=2692781 RepID=UPI00177B3ED3|nr:DUF1643 domain-containing protein [Chroococcidiopsis sp. [FACHB-1243]]MBD2304218.1 DUF1643 domain-containing protein [Chroococcidiopsis sp. [FACHB-1243]]